MWDSIKRVVFWFIGIIGATAVIDAVGNFGLLRGAYNLAMDNNNSENNQDEQANNRQGEELDTKTPDREEEAITDKPELIPAAELSSRVETNDSHQYEELERFRAQIKGFDPEQLVDTTYLNNLRQSINSIKTRILTLQEEKQLIIKSLRALKSSNTTDDLDVDKTLGFMMTKSTMRSTDYHHLNTLIEELNSTEGLLNPDRRFIESPQSFDDHRNNIRYAFGLKGENILNLLGSMHKDILGHAQDRILSIDEITSTLEKFNQDFELYNLYLNSAKAATAVTQYTNFIIANAVDPETITKIGGENLTYNDTELNSQLAIKTRNLAALCAPGNCKIELSSSEDGNKISLDNLVRGMLPQSAKEALQP
jgi:hypothetical protein